MGKWFETCFLPSLFQRAGTGKGMWLTAKQTAICADNMEAHHVRNEMAYGVMYNRVYYTCNWQGRAIVLDYSKKNGCGCIRFSMNAEEAAESKKVHDAERAKIEAECIARLKRHPERLAKVIKETRERMEGLEWSLNEDGKEGIEIRVELVEQIESEIANLKKYLEALCA